MSADTFPHFRLTRNRREFIRDAFCGFGSLALASILSEERARAGLLNPLATKAPHPNCAYQWMKYISMAKPQAQ